MRNKRGFERNMFTFLDSLAKRNAAFSYDM